MGNYKGRVSDAGRRKDAHRFGTIPSYQDFSWSLVADVHERKSEVTGRGKRCFKVLTPSHFLPSDHGDPRLSLDPRGMSRGTLEDVQHHEVAVRHEQRISRPWRLPMRITISCPMGANSAATQTKGDQRDAATANPSRMTLNKKRLREVSFAFSRGVTEMARSPYPSAATTGIIVKSGVPGPWTGGALIRGHQSGR